MAEHSASPGRCGSPATPRVCPLRPVRRLAGLQMAHDSLDPSARRRVGSIRGIQRLDLPADAIGELAARTGRKGWLPIRLRHALRAATALSGWTNTGDTTHPWNSSADRERLNLWLAVADQSAMTRYRLSGLSYLSDQRN